MIIANDDSIWFGAYQELLVKFEAAVKCFEELEKKGILLPAK